MKLLSLIGLLVFTTAHAQTSRSYDHVVSNSLAVGSSAKADAKTALDVVSTTKAARPCPPMTSTQRDAIASPATGSCVFNTTSNQINSYDGSTWGAIAGSGSSGNLLTNGGFESGTSNWTSSGGAFGTTSTAANVGEGLNAGTWDSSASSQTLTYAAITVTSGDGVSGQNITASVRIKVASAATHTLEIYDGTNILASATIANSTTQFVRTTVTTIAPASGTVYFRLKSVASNEPNIFVDSAFLGLSTSFNISQISQAQMYGGVKWVGTASCEWTNTSTSWGSYSANANCTTPTGSNVVGYASAPGTKIPAITFATLPPGEYRVMATGTFRTASASKSTAGCSYRMTDGTTPSGTIENYAVYPSATNPDVRGGTMLARFQYSTAQSNITFQFQAQNFSNSESCNILDDSSTARGLEIYVYYFPSAIDTAFKAETTNWKVDANISGANPSLGTSAQTAYIGIEDASLTLTNNTGVGNIAAQIPCSSTNAPTGTTCSVGNESVGVSFLLPSAQDVRACVSFAHNIVTSTTGVVNATFEIVETPTNAQTISQEGKSRVQSGFNTASSTITFPHQVCGTFSFASAGQKVLRLMYEQAITATVTTNQLFGDVGANNGQRDIHWEVYPITQQVPMPVIVGSVGSNTTASERIERATVVCGSSASITAQSGSWISSIANIASNRCAITIAAGMFSATPTCTASVANTTTTVVYSAVPNPTSSTALSVGCVNQSSSVTTACAGPDTFQIQCMGPR